MSVLSAGPACLWLLNSVLTLTVSCGFVFGLDTHYWPQSLARAVETGVKVKGQRSGAMANLTWYKALGASVVAGAASQGGRPSALAKSALDFVSGFY